MYRTITESTATGEMNPKLSATFRQWCEHAELNFVEVGSSFEDQRLKIV